jgi:hypothetical protein
VRDNSHPRLEELIRRAEARSLDWRTPTRQFNGDPTATLAAIATLLGIDAMAAYDESRSVEELEQEGVALTTRNEEIDREIQAYFDQVDKER